ncbi:MAG: hypothetical protein MJZ68_00170 [archaeon]|nr:hypothetical protein [archaeon]
MLFSGAAAVVADDSAAFSATITDDSGLDYQIVEPKGSLTYTLTYTEEEEGLKSYSATYNATINASTGSVSTSSGSLTEKVGKTLTVTAPEDTGTYKLTVVITEKYTVEIPATDDKAAETVEKSRTLTVEEMFKVVEPIELKVTVKNNGHVDIIDADVSFFVDGVKIEDSNTTYSVAVGETTDITYKYLTDKLSAGSHTFQVKPSENASVGVLGLDEEHTFYIDQGSTDYMSYIMAIIFIVILIGCAWVLRKPVKNYGKPKNRR